MDIWHPITIKEEPYPASGTLDPSTMESDFTFTSAKFVTIHGCRHFQPCIELESEPRGTLSCRGLCLRLRREKDLLWPKIRLNQHSRKQRRWTSFCGERDLARRAAAVEFHDTVEVDHLSEDAYNFTLCKNTWFVRVS